MAASVLITGAGGFAAGHLCALLAGMPDLTLAGIARHPPQDLPGQPRMLVGDLRDRAFVFAALEACRPDVVLHLAAQSSVDESWRDAAATVVNNVAGQANLLDAVYQHCPHARVLVVGSADEYGLVRPDEVPVDEQQPLRPNNPYAISKVAQDMQALQYGLGRGLAVVRVRPFNHTGPGQRADFVASAFARQVASVEAGLQPPVVRVGNLDAQRDFTDVRDTVRAHWLAATQGTPGDVYNIASGRATSVRSLLDSLINLARVDVRVEVDSTRLRPSDVPILLGSAAKLTRETGWTPTIPLERTLSDLLDYWRDDISRRSQ